MAAGFRKDMGHRARVAERGVTGVAVGKIREIGKGVAQDFRGGAGR